MLGWWLPQPCSPVNWLLQGWLYFCKWPVCKSTSVCIAIASICFVCPHFSHTWIVCVIFVSRSQSRLPLYPICSNVLQEHPSFWFRPLILCVVPSVAWGEDGIDELHVVGYVNQELLVCSANFTYMQWVCLHYTVCVCCIHTYNILNKNIYIKVYCNVSNILNAI